MANEYKPTQYFLLESLPGVTKDAKTGETDTVTYIQGLFTLIITIAIVLAVIRIIWGGFIKLSSDAWTKRSEANDIIYNAIFGLILTFGAWMIVATVLGSKDGKLDFNLAIPREEVKSITAGGTCNNCIAITLPHKSAPQGCKAPGPCQINKDLHTKLASLHRLRPLYITESYPPTITHRSGCHSTGDCVDATISAASENNIKSFIEDATRSGLNAQFETTTEKRAEDIRRATGLTRSQVFYVPGINGEHFSIYNR